MSSPFNLKLFGRAVNHLKGGLKQRLGSAVLPAGMVLSTQPQRILAHPKTGQLILQGMAIQPKEGMYSVFSMEGVEILVRYSKILAYTLPSAPVWKDTEMVYVSPKLDALSLHKGANFTIFVGRVHYLVTVIERLTPSKSATVERTRPVPEESNSDTDSDGILLINSPSTAHSPEQSFDRTLEDQMRQLQEEHTPFLSPKMTTHQQLRTPPTANPAPRNSIPRSPIFTDPFEPRLRNDRSFADTTSEPNVTESTPIPPQTPVHLVPHGSFSSRILPTPVSPCDLKDSKNRSKREIGRLPTASEMTKQTPTKKESRKTPPSLKQRPNIPLSEYRTRPDINGKKCAEPVSHPQALRGKSRTPNPSAYGSHSSYRTGSSGLLNHVEAVTSKTHSTYGSRKYTSKIKSRSSRPNMKANEERWSAQPGKESRLKVPSTQRSASSSRIRSADLERELSETLLLTPKFQELQIVIKEDLYFTCNGDSQAQPAQQYPPSRKESSPSPLLRTANDEIVDPNSIPRNMPRIGASRRNLTKTFGFKEEALHLAPVPSGDPLESTRTSSRFVLVFSPPTPERNKLPDRLT